MGHWMMGANTITSPVQAAELNSISPNQGTYLPTCNLSLSLSLGVSIVTLPYCLSIYRCRSCNCVITADDLEDWAHNQFEDHTHLLHAVVHSNGYAHLLTVNGREGGSLFLSGRHIMDFWDRLSTSLAVRSALLSYLYHICNFPSKF